MTLNHMTYAQRLVTLQNYLVAIRLSYGCYFSSLQIQIIAFVSFTKLYQKQLFLAKKNLSLYQIIFERIVDSNR